MIQKYFLVFKKYIFQIFFFTIFKQQNIPGEFSFTLREIHFSRYTSCCFKRHHDNTLASPSLHLVSTLSCPFIHVKKKQYFAEFTEFQKQDPSITSPEAHWRCPLHCLPNTYSLSLSISLTFFLSLSLSYFVAYSYLHSAILCDIYLACNLNEKHR